MSDWKSRAQPLEESTNDWKSRAQQSDSKDESFLQTVGNTIDRAGPAQIRNLIAVGLGQKENSLQNNKDILTGKNSPSYSDILNKSGLPSASINFQSDGALPDGFKVSGLTNKQEYDLKTVDTGINTNDILGAAADLTIGNKATSLVTKSLSKVPNLIKYLGNNANDFSEALKHIPIQNIDEIEAAAKRLNLVPIDAMKNGNVLARDLESGLSQSGSWPAAEIRNKYNDFFQGVDSASKKINDLKTSNSSFNIGKNLGQNIEKNVELSKAPVKEMYDSLTNELIKIPVNESVVNQEIGILKKNPIFKTKDGVSFLEKYGDDLKTSSENLADLKEFRTNLRSSLGNTASNLDHQRVDHFYDAVTNIRNKSIGMADEVVNGGKAGAQLADSLASDISLADMAHAENMKDINSLKELVGSKTDFKSTNNFIEKLRNISEEDLAKRSANLSTDTMYNIEKKFPELYNRIKESKINQMIKASTDVNGFNESRFIKNFNSLGKESQAIVFEPEMVQHIKDLETIKNAIPDKLGPSGTPKGLLTMEAFSPKRNLKDYLIKNSISNNNGSNLLKRSAIGLNSAANVLNSSIDVFGNASKVAVFDSSLNNNINKKGFDKWVNTGIAKITDSDPSIDSQFLNKIANSKNGQDVLLLASEASPKSIKNIVEKIKNSDEFNSYKKESNKSNSIYPMVLKKGGAKATVTSDQDLAEAMSEGWSK